MTAPTARATRGVTWRQAVGLGWLSAPLLHMLDNGGMPLIAAAFIASAFTVVGAYLVSWDGSLWDHS